MKYLNRLLCRWPWAYFYLMRLRKGSADEKRLYLSLVKRGDVVFDVGANVGYFSDLFASIIGNEGKLYSFEPSPETVKELQHSVEGHANVRIVNAACGDSEGEVELFQKGDDSGQASLRQQKKASWAGEAEVKAFRCPIIRLDGFIQKEKIERIDFLKCDVEGAEMLAFRGLGSELKRLSPVVFFELFPAFMGSFGFKPEDLFAHLREQGYDAFYQVSEVVTPFEQEDIAELSENSAPLNILALRLDRHMAAVACLEKRGLLERGE